MTEEGSILFRDVHVGRVRTDVLVAGGRIRRVGERLRPDGAADTPGVEIVDGDGGALIPGLHDHHIHLLATAAARSSVAVGPDDVGGPDGLAATLRAAAAADLDRGR